MIWIVLISGIFNTIMGLITNTENILSAFAFKVIPVFLGLGCLLYASRALGII